MLPVFDSTGDAEILRRANQAGHKMEADMHSHPHQIPASWASPPRNGRGCGARNQRAASYMQAIFRSSMNLENTEQKRGFIPSLCCNDLYEIICPCNDLRNITFPFYLFTFNSTAYLRAVWYCFESFVIDSLACLNKRLHEVNQGLNIRICFLRRPST